MGIEKGASGKEEKNTHTAQPSSAYTLRFHLATVFFFIITYSLEYSLKKLYNMLKSTCTESEQAIVSLSIIHFFCSKKSHNIVVPHAVCAGALTLTTTTLWLFGERELNGNGNVNEIENEYDRNECVM